MLAQATVNGILLGGLYGLATVGFSMVWGVMGVINLAHTSFIMLGAYLTYFMFDRLGVDPIVSMPIAMAAMFVLGYGIQRLIKQWGKDQVVNVEQRTSLYRTIERLLGAGLIAVRETGRDPRYPERTVYEVTEAGRQTARRWLEEMLAEPRQEYPEFPAALSHVLMLEPAELAGVLERRAQRLAAMLAALDANTAAEAGHGLPRIAMLENEYQRAVLAAEARWVAETVTELRSGQLTWSPAELIAFAEGQ